LVDEFCNWLVGLGTGATGKGRERALEHDVAVGEGAVDCELAYVETTSGVKGHKASTAGTNVSSAPVIRLATSVFERSLVPMERHIERV
jgi:hypothetical protein